jgi:para-aminobenzoate synthetase component 1
MSTPMPRAIPLPRLSWRMTPRVAPALPAGETWDETSFAQRCRIDASNAPHVLLLSGGDHVCSRLSIAVLRPAMIFEAKDGLCRVTTARGVSTFAADPFDILDRLLERFWSDEGPVPRIAGYVAYEAGRAIETLPSRAADDLLLPDMWMCWPTVQHVYDRATGRVESWDIAWTDDIGILDPLFLGTDSGAFTSAADPFSSAVASSDAEDASPASLSRSFDRDSYVAAVERVRRHIFDGDVYQVNLSQRYRFALREDPFALWMRLFAENPAPFYAYVDAPGHQVLSTSMERFFLVDGERIETRPIKGTRPRGADEEETRRFAAELLGSAKDEAELSMIVDLERNDLGKICGAGSVRVAAHRRVERFADVQHMVSVVEGRLLPGTGIGDIFRALFPGGSVTGCPKIRAMEIIDAIEPQVRHAYTGAIGYIAADGGADFNIAIRTAIVRDGICHLSVGGGIVYDSDPLEEYFETLHKGRTFFRIAGIRTELDERD